MRRIHRLLTLLAAAILLLGTAALPALAEGVTVEAHAYGQDYSGDFIPGVEFNVTDSSGELCGFTRTDAGRYAWGGSETTLGTDASGVLVFTGVPADRLSVTQTTVPEGVYEITNNPITIWGTADNILNFFNQARTLKLRAQDARTGVRLRTSFGLKKDGADVILAKKSGSNYFDLRNGTGTAVLAAAGTSGVTCYRLDEGTYTASAEALPGYHAPGAETVAVTREHTVTFSMVPTAVELQRFTSGGTAVDGAVYQVLDASGRTVRLAQESSGEYAVSSSGSLTTFRTSGGTARIYQLGELGGYTIRETSPAPGYRAGTDAVFTVAADAVPDHPQAVRMSAEEAPKLYLQISQTDPDTGAPVNGVFEITDAGGIPVGDPVVLTNGTVTAGDLGEGRYELRQLSADAGYAVKSGTTAVTLTASNTQDNPARVTFAASPLTLKISKVDAADKSPLSGISFEIRDSAGALLSFSEQSAGVYRVSASGTASAATGTDGCLLVKGIPAGTYTVHETESAGYAQAEDQTVTVSVQNGADYPAVAGFENWKLHAVVTVSDRDTGLRIPGIPLHIRDASGTELHFRENPDHSWDPADSGNPVSGSDGTAVLNGMPKGTWSVTADAPEGYLPAEGTSLTVSGSSTQSAPAAAKVQLALSAARITKTDRDTAEPLEGVRFTLKKDGTGIPMVLLPDGTWQTRSTADPNVSAAEESDSVETGADGTVTVLGLPAGSIEAVETKVKGFVPLTGITVTVAEGNDRSHPAGKDVRNIPTKLTVTAKDPDTGAALAGSEYQVKDEDGNVILLEDLGNGIYRPSRTGEGTDHVTVGESGVCIVKYLEGDVTITQSKTVPGYAEAEPAAVTVGDDPVQEGTTDPDAGSDPVDMSAEALAVEIRSRKSGSEAGLTGAVFQLKDESGNAVRLTERNGAYVVSASGTETEIRTDSGGKARILAIPEGQYTLTEIQAPDGYFPVTAQDLTVRNSHTASNPLTVEVIHTPEVRLGLDTDRYERVIFIAGIGLIAGGVIGLAVIAAKARRGKRK